MSYNFFENRDCKYYPCHKGIPEGEFNCLFCWCPLYALGEKCGGNFVWSSKGVKVCTNCTFPHRKENYEKIKERFPEIAELAKKKE